MLAVRHAYLSGDLTPAERSTRARKHWDQIQERMRASARSSRAVPEFVTSLARGLRIEAPDSYLSGAQVELARLAAERGAPKLFRLIDSEYSYIMALARLRADQLREEREVRQAEREREKGSDPDWVAGEGAA